MKINKRILKAAVSLAFFIVLFRIVRARDLAAMLRGIDPFYLVLSLLCSPVMIMTSCLKWKALLDLQGTPLGFWRLMRIYFIGYYFSNILPSNFGGDVARSYYAGRDIKSQSRAAVSVFIERLTGMVLLLILVVTLPFFYKGIYGHPAVLIPSAGAAGILVIVLWLFGYTRPVTAFFGAMLRILNAMRRVHVLTSSVFLGRILARLITAAEELRGKADGFHDKLRTAALCLKRDSGSLLWVATLTAVFYVMTWVNVFLSFRAFGAHPSFGGVAAVLPVSMAVAMIPITLGSLGIAEGSYVFYFGLIGMDRAATLAMGLLLRCKMVLTGLIGLAFYITDKTNKPSNIEEITNAGS